jgi:hypothetical protein
MRATDLQAKFVEQLLPGFNGRTRETGGLDTGVTDVCDFSNGSFVIRACGFTKGVEL